MEPRLDWSAASASHRSLALGDLAEDVVEVFDDGHPTIIDDEFASHEHPPLRAGFRHPTDFA